MKLLFLGDFCLGNGAVPHLETELKALFSSADLICVNFEAPIVFSSHSPAPKSGPVIYQSSSALQCCREWGITHVSMANNHIMDYGNDGLINTIKQLDGIEYFGAAEHFDEAYRPCLFVKDGMRIALLSFAEAQFGVLQDECNADHAGYAWIDHPRARKAVSEARLQADWVIVQVHAGLEMVDIPLPEWRWRYKELIDLGADLVIGHHPHVIQGSECYKDKIIYYSLGNFYMDTMLSDVYSGSGAALLVTLDGTGIDSEFIPLITSRSKVGFDGTGSGMASYLKLTETISDYKAYYAEIESICDHFWKNVYCGYYETALFGLGTRPNWQSFLRLLRRLAGRILYGQQVSMLHEQLLIHNIRIETHRWVVERALQKLVGRLL